MTERNSIDNMRLIFAIAVFLLFCGGVQSAFGCLLPENQAYSSEIRVNSCHLVVNQKKTPSCCQIVACHQSTPQKPDLGNQEYHTQHKGLYSLFHESRPLTPQLKVGKPFSTKHIILPQFFPLTRVLQTPLQALYNLRTVVLLN